MVTIHWSKFKIPIIPLFSATKIQETFKSKSNYPEGVRTGMIIHIATCVSGTNIMSLKCKTKQLLFYKFAVISADKLFYEYTFNLFQCLRLCFSPGHFRLVLIQLIKIRRVFVRWRSCILLCGNILLNRANFVLTDMGNGSEVDFVHLAASGYQR